MNVNLFDIQRASTVDGPGVRTVVFFKGCNLRCLWCHNPESQKSTPQLMVYRDSCTNCGKCGQVCDRLGDEKIVSENCIACGKCADFCPSDARKLCGYTKNTADILKILRKDLSYYRKSGGGVTFSGGECLLQPDAVTELLMSCQTEGINTAVDTAGHVDREIFEKISPLADWFLYDIKAMDSELHRLGTGVRNEKILANLDYLLKTCPDKVILRCPVIPGYNDTNENFTALRDYLAKRNSPAKVELLPYHRLGENKYPALGLEERVYDIPPAERMEEFRNIMEI